MENASEGLVRGLPRERPDAHVRADVVVRLGRGSTVEGSAGRTWARTASAAAAAATTATAPRTAAAGPRTTPRRARGKTRTESCSSFAVWNPPAAPGPRSFPAASIILSTFASDMPLISMRNFFGTVMTDLTVAYPASLTFCALTEKKSLSGGRRTRARGKGKGKERGERARAP